MAAYSVALLVLLCMSVAAETDKVNAPPNATEYGAWSLICPEPTQQEEAAKQQGAASSCSLSQIIVGGNQVPGVALGIALYWVPSRPHPTIDFRFSPKAVAKAGVGIWVAPERELRLPISKCDNLACLASGEVDETVLSLFTSHASGKFAFLLPEDQQMILPISFQGFKEGFQALKDKVGK